MKGNNNTKYISENNFRSRVSVIMEDEENKEKVKELKEYLK